MTNLGEGNGNPFQYSGLENPIDGGARVHPRRRPSLATVHVVTRSRTRLSDFTSLHDKPTADIILNGEKLKALSS